MKKILFLMLAIISVMIGNAAEKAKVSDAATLESVNELANVLLGQSTFNVSRHSQFDINSDGIIDATEYAIAMEKLMSLSSPSKGKAIHPTIAQTYLPYIEDDPDNYATIGVMPTDDLSKVPFWIGSVNNTPMNTISFGVAAPAGYTFSKTGSGANDYLSLSTLGTNETGGTPRLDERFSLISRLNDSQTLSGMLNSSYMYCWGPKGCGTMAVCNSSYGPLVDGYLNMKGAPDGQYTIKLFGTAADRDYVSLSAYWPADDPYAPAGAVAGASTFQGYRQYLQPNLTFTIEGGKVVKAFTTDPAFAKELDGKIMAPRVSEASDITESSFVANWYAVADATSYKLYVSSNGELLEGYPVSVEDTHYEVTGLKLLSFYTYYVTAVDANEEESEPSGIIEVWTDQGPGPFLFGNLTGSDWDPKLGGVAVPATDTEGVYSGTFQIYSYFAVALKMSTKTADAGGWDDLNTNYRYVPGELGGDIAAEGATVLPMLPPGNGGGSFHVEVPGTYKITIDFNNLILIAEAHPYDFMVDGLCYNINDGGSSVTVTSERNIVSSQPSYYSISGDISIPPTVSHDGITYAVTSINKNTFYRCTELTSVTIPNSVITIADNAFNTCNNLTSVAIGESVSSIGNNAFLNCNSITSLLWNAKNCADLPSATNSHPFYGCNSLQTVVIGNEVERIPGYFMKSFQSLTDVTIPNSVSEIGNSAFYGCHSLSTVTLGNGITKIDDLAFSSCRGLSRMNSYADPANVTLGSYVFAVPPTACELHVLSQYLDTYKTADQWKDFKIIIGDLTDSAAGDINGDSSVDGNDVSILLEMVLAGGVSAEQMPVADINGDNSVDGNDVSILLEMVLSGN